MLLRIRSRDGTERCEVADSATLSDLRQKIQTELNVPIEQQTLSLNQALLMSKNPAAFTDLKEGSRTLRGLGLKHGDMVYLKCDMERTIAPVAKISTVPFGQKMTVADMIATQTRIEPQEKPHCMSCSFDAHAANTFQSYVRDTLGFSIQRCGFLYGERAEDGAVKVHFIYEPPQEGSADDLILLRNAEEEKCVDFIAAQLGYFQVGLVLTHSDSNDREYNVSGKQAALMAEMQAAGGEHFVTAVVSLDETEDDEKFVNFEAFQLSDQCVKLCKDGWIQQEQAVENSEKAGFLQVSSDVIVAGKDTREIDTDFLLVAVPILDHEGPLAHTFPVENRLLAQTTNDLRDHLTATASKAYCERLADFHLLLFLSKSLDLGTDMALLVDAVKTKGTVAEGYRLIIDSIAGVG